MKKTIITLLLALTVGTGQAQVQPTTALLGSWSGKLKAGVASLTIVLHLEQADGYVKVSFDSPDQGAKGIAASKEFLSDDSLSVKMEQLKKGTEPSHHFLSTSTISPTYITWMSPWE